MARLIIGIIIGMIIGGGGTYFVMNNALSPLQAQGDFEGLPNVLSLQDSCTQLLKKQFEIQSSAPIVDGQAIFSATEQDELAKLDEQISQTCGEITEEQATKWINGIVANIVGES